MEVRIDELAQRAGVPSRTIRYYTQQGLLPPPHLKGRVGYYSEQHLERIRLVKELQEKRFLPLSVIQGVIRGIEAGVDLDAMLAPLDFVFAPRDAQPGALTRTALLDRAGVDREVLEAAEDMGFLSPAGSGTARRYGADDVHLLAVTEEWLRLGLPRELGHLYRSALEDIARAQVEAFHEVVVQPLSDKELPPDELRDSLTEAYRAMGQTFTRVMALLHRRALQQAVERYAAVLSGEGPG